jgi:predicted DNA binding CopG/RHH family protein
MAKKLIIPTFKTEAEDAAWHESHKEELEEEMGRRIRGGKTRTLAEAMGRAKTRLRPVTIRLPMEDIDVARELAAEKGLGYQTYIRMVLRETLHRRTRKQSRSPRK